MRRKFFPERSLGFNLNFPLAPKNQLFDEKNLSFKCLQKTVSYHYDSLCLFHHDHDPRKNHESHNNHLLNRNRLPLDIFDIVFSSTFSLLAQQIFIFLNCFFGKRISIALLDGLRSLKVLKSHTMPSFICIS